MKLFLETPERTPALSMVMCNGEGASSTYPRRALASFSKEEGLNNLELGGLHLVLGSTGSLSKEITIFQDVSGNVLKTRKEGLGSVSPSEKHLSSAFQDKVKALESLSGNVLKQENFDFKTYQDDLASSGGEMGLLRVEFVVLIGNPMS